jgi:uncharacterized protein
MDLASVATNFLSPPILFFLLGMAATFLRSDLDLPAPLPKVLSLYLLFAIGFKGGVELNHSGFTAEVVITAGVAVLMAFVVPVYAFFILRLKLDTPNAAAIAAAYGSVSAVAFITAQSYLESLRVPYSGHMVAALALMESPAIVVGVLFARLGARASSGEKPDWGHLGRDAFLNGSVFILMGAVLVGALTGARGEARMAPFVTGLFPGALALFLLDMGIVAARRLGDLRKLGWFPPAFAVLIPALNATLGWALTRLIGLSPGDTVLFMSLCFGASYIAVPAAMRMAVPEANPSLYVTMALAITFPIHIVIGIPLFAQIAGAGAP